MAELNFQYAFDKDSMQDELVSLQRDLQYYFLHLDHKNVRRLYTEYCEIQSQNGQLAIDGPVMRFYGSDTTLQRMNLGLSTATNDFGFSIWNQAGDLTAYLDSTGELIVRRLLSGYIEGSTIIGSQITGSTITGGQITGSTITGGQITGSTITGGTIKTAESGARIEMTDNSIFTYNGSSNFNGPCWGSTGTFGATYGDLYFYDNGTKVLEFFNNLSGNGYSIRPTNSAALNIGANSLQTYLYGNINHMNNIGFFGTTAVSKTTVSTLSTDATAAATIDKVNEIIGVLQGYGLF